jgi:hypothetical protein
MASALSEVLGIATRTSGAKEYRLLEGSREMASFTINRKRGVRGDRARLSSRLHLHGWPRVASSVTDNFGNRDNLSRGASEHQKE